MSILKDESTKTKHRIGVAIFLFTSIIAMIYFNPVSQGLLGIDNIEFKFPGTYSYYVEIENDKYEYVLPGQIRIDKYDNDTDYFVERVYFSNGGYLHFEDCIAEIGEPVRAYDQEGKRWTVTLINEHAYSPQITETNIVSVGDYVILLLGVGGALFSIASLFYVRKSRE